MAGRGRRPRQRRPAPCPSASPGSGLKPRTSGERQQENMRLTEGQAGARVLAFGGYQPARVVTNDELAQTVETDDEWIRSRVGIASRRIAGPDETVADMAVQ